MYFDQYLVSLGCRIGELMFEMQKILSLYGYEYCNTTQFNTIQCKQLVIYSSFKTVLLSLVFSHKICCFQKKDGEMTQRWPIWYLKKKFERQINKVQIYDKAVLNTSIFLPQIIKSCMADWFRAGLMNVCLIRYHF